MKTELEKSAQVDYNGKIEIARETILKIYEIIGKGRLSGEGDLSKVPSFEFMDEAMGTAYVQTWYVEDTEQIGIEKYYENELFNDRFGKLSHVNMNFDNPSETIAIVTKILESFQK